MLVVTEAVVPIENDVVLDAVATVVVAVVIKADGLHSCNICVTIFQHVALCCIEYVSLPQIAFLAYTY